MLARFDGANLRFAGTLDVEHHRGTALLEEHSNEAIWELMYFGHARSLTQTGSHRARTRRTQIA